MKLTEKQIEKTLDNMKLLLKQTKELCTINSHHYSKCYSKDCPFKSPYASKTGNVSCQLLYAVRQAKFSRLPLNWNVDALFDYDFISSLDEYPEFDGVNYPTLNELEKYISTRLDNSLMLYKTHGKKSTLKEIVEEINKRGYKPEGMSSVNTATYKEFIQLLDHYGLELDGGIFGYGC